MTRMILLRAQNASNWTGPTGNNTFLFLGHVPALIDAGVGDPGHVTALAAALGDEALEAVLITHGHSDHIKGVPTLLERWPAAKVLRLGDGLADGEVIWAGDRQLRVVHTPGHAPDHVCLFDEPAGDMYTGDLIRLGGTIVVPATKGGSLRHYLASLRRVRELAPRRLLPAHGPAIENVTGAINRYLRHRQEREQQVIEALRDGLDTPEAIASRVYGLVHPEIAAAAADSILAHLIKLEEDGAAARSSGNWRGIDSIPR